MRYAVPENMMAQFQWGSAGPLVLGLLPRLSAPSELNLLSPGSQKGNSGPERQRHGIMGPLANRESVT